MLFTYKIQFCNKNIDNITGKGKVLYNFKHFKALSGEFVLFIYCIRVFIVALRFWEWLNGNKFLLMVSGRNKNHWIIVELRHIDSAQTKNSLMCKLRTTKFDWTLVLFLPVECLLNASKLNKVNLIDLIGNSNQLALICN